MASIRDRLAGNLNGDGHDSMGEEWDDSGRSAKIGARAAKCQAAFLPQREEEGVAIEYSGLMFESFRRDWTQITLHYVTHQIVIDGQNLKGLLRQIMSHHVDWVEVADPLHLASGEAQFEVTGIRVQVREG